MAFAVRDKYPVSEGHTLVIPRRAVSTWFDATVEEQRALLELAGDVKSQLDAEFTPDGYNVGFNSGAAAGQTVMHLHVHVIPRYRGDMDDPRGEVRHVIPSKGNYLSKTSALATGGVDDAFGHHVFPLFDKAEDIAIVAAFVQASGSANAVARCAQTDSSVSITSRRLETGVRTSSPEWLRAQMRGREDPLRVPRASLRDPRRVLRDASSVLLLLTSSPAAPAAHLSESRRSSPSEF